MKSSTRSPGIRRAVARAQRLGYAVQFVEVVAGATHPAVIPPAGLCDMERRRILVGTRDLSQPGAPLNCRAKLQAILEHELEHAEGAEFATDRPEFGLVCGGMRGGAALALHDYAFTDDLEPVRHRYRVNMESVPGMYAQYDGYVDVWSDSGDWGDVFRAAVAELRRTAFPERGAGAWRMRDFHLIG